jgi:hypothetical protein
MNSTGSTVSGGFVVASEGAAFVNRLYDFLSLSHRIRDSRSWLQGLSPAVRLGELASGKIARRRREASQLVSNC